MVGPLSKKLFAKAKTLIPGGVNSPVRAFKNVDGDPFFVRRAKGSRITDVDDKTYIDYVGTWGPAILGHAPILITQTIHEVAKDGVALDAPELTHLMALAGGELPVLVVAQARGRRQLRWQPVGIDRPCSSQSRSWKPPLDC